MIYIANSFSPSMVTSPSLVRFIEITDKEFCEAVRNPESVNSIGHQGTVDVINSVCGANLKMNRIQIRAKPGDVIYIAVLTVRLEEGKVLNSQELSQMLEQGKVKFIKAVIYKDIVDDLKRCKGVCNEKEYDAIIDSLGGDQ